MTIVSCLAETASLFQYVWRGRILYRDDRARPAGAGKWSVSSIDARILRTQAN